MRNRILSFFALGWVILLIGACQSDSIDPNPAAISLNQVAEDLFVEPFILQMTIDGPDSYVDPLGRIDDRPEAHKELACIGKSEVEGTGVVISQENRSVVRLDFDFDPLNCNCEGKLRVDFDNPPCSYVFDISGIGHVAGSLYTSDEIKIPLELEYCSGDDEYFTGYLYLTEPELLAKGQEGVVMSRARIVRIPVW